MSKTNRFLAKVGRGMKRVGERLENSRGNAADSVRAKGLQIRIDEQYENLGRVVYRDLHTEENLEEVKLEIIAKIDALFDELEEIKAAKLARKVHEIPCESQDDTQCDCECECEEAAEAAECEDTAECEEIAEAQGEAEEAQ